LSSLLAIGFAAPWAYTEGPIFDEATTKQPSTYLQALEVVEPMVRQYLSQQLPKEAVEDFFALGALYPPFNREKFEATIEWAKKWKLADMDLLEKFNYDEIQAIQIRLLEKIDAFFRNLHVASSKFAHLSRAETVHLEDVDGLIELYGKLSPVEQNVLDEAARHFAKELGDEIRYEKKHQIESDD
ncbi:hypothetical protein PFISCL1PPCAC_27931, partial [Pristionchus fissidentatus]